MSVIPFDKQLEAAIADLGNLTEEQFAEKWKNYPERLKARTTKTLRDFANSDILEA